MNAIGGVIEVRDGAVELVGLAGHRMYSVTFVEDYLQLHFEGAFRLTAVTWPRVRDANHREWCMGQPGYRDALCSQIGKRVAHAAVRPGEAARFEFADASEILVPLDDGSYRTEEALIFEDTESHRFGVW